MCDDAAQVYISRDADSENDAAYYTNGGSWNLTASSTDWSKSYSLWIESVNPSTDAIRVTCYSPWGPAGFAATIYYDFMEYPTTNSTNNVWTVVAHESYNSYINSSLVYLGSMTNPPAYWSSADTAGLSDDAYWVWGLCVSPCYNTTMTFEFRFGDTTTNPTTDPTTNPTTNAPTVQPTERTTTLFPTLSEPVTQNCTLSLNADYNELQKYTNSSNQTMFDVAEDIIRSGLGIDDNAALSDIIITILSVRSGSIIIDYVLTSNSEESLSFIIRYMLSFVLLYVIYGICCCFVIFTFSD